MKKILLSIFGLVLALTVGAQTNLITNPGFETGDDTGWAGYNRSVIAAADAYEGAYVGAINDDAAGSFLYPSIAVTPGSTYRFALAAKWPNGCSVPGIAMVVKTVTDGVTYPNNTAIGQTPVINTTDWKVDSMELVVPDGVTEVKLVQWKAKSEICYIDSLVFYEVLNPNPLPDLTQSDDGEIKETAEDGEVITVNMTNDIFADPLVPGNWTVSNLPEGVTVGAITRVSDTQATITLSGNTTGDYDVDITNFEVQITGAEFTNYEWPVSINTGVTFIATVEVVTEELVWEEDFSTWTPDIVIDSAYLAGMGFRTQGDPDSIKILDGYGVMYTSEANGKNNWIFRTIELIPGAQYIYSVDLKTPAAGKTFGVVWRAQEDQLKTNEVLSTEWTNATVQFQVDPDKDTVELGVYRWGFPKETHFDNMKLTIITDPLIQASSDGEILEGSEEGEKIIVTAMYDTFVASPNIANWSATGLPAGVSLGSLNRVDDTTVEILLAGNASVDYDADSLVVISVTEAEFVTSSIPLTAYAPVTFTAIVEPPPTASITFIVDDTKMASATGFAIKGSWVTATGVYDVGWNNGDEHSEFFDDGTHGDVTAGDHIWTVTLELVPDGGANTWEWGVNDSEDIWLDGNFPFTVTDGTAQTLAAYVILNNDASLSALSLDVGTLDPAFDAETTSYTADVPAGTTSVTVSATATDATAATITGNVPVDVSSGSATADIVVTAEDGSTKTYTIVITVLVGIEQSMIDGLQLYPNPVVNRLNISAESTIESVRVYDLLGSKVFEMRQINAAYFELDTDSWKSGVYIINIKDNKDRKSVYKVVK